MDTSFTPDGTWFVFDVNGKTLKRGFASKASALTWIAAELRKTGAV